MNKFICFVLIATSLSLYGQSKKGKGLSKEKQQVLESIQGSYSKYTEIADKIWGFAEIGYQEHKSSTLLQETLTENGFSVEAGVAGIPTAFVASWGSGKPVVGILAEFDALPGLSQQAVPEEKPAEGLTSGHGCGHHLFGTASAASAIAVKEWMEKSGKTGTIRVYGTPAEEGGSGKVYMVREGLFNDVDAVLNWHPSSSNSANPRYSLSNKTGKFRFYGVSAHAAGAPERGRSALDAVEAMNYMANMMREHVTDATRIHYIITKGGDAPNVVPNFAEVYFYVRHPDSEEVKKLWERLVNIAKGAALGTDTRVEYEVTGAVYSLLPNEALAKIMYNNLLQVGGYALSEEEKAFAVTLQKSFTGGQEPLETTQKIEAYKESRGGGSTDVGDVSWNVPTAGLRTATWVPGTPAHSWQAVACGGTSIGHKGMMMAAKTMALSAVDLFNDPKLAEQAQAELKEKQGEGFKYEPLLGDRKPALDYRK